MHLLFRMHGDYWCEGEDRRSREWRKEPGSDLLRKQVHRVYQTALRSSHSLFWKSHIRPAYASCRHTEAL